MGKDATVDLSWWGLTDKGPFRKNNEDAFLALTFDAHEVRLLGKEGEADFALGDFVFAVSDGMGGAKAGEFASRIAVQKLTERMPHLYRSREMGREGAPEAALVDLFGHIHTEMRMMGTHYEECQGMGATLSLLWLSPGRAVFCHAGDSRIYHLTAGHSLVQLTEDHTHAGWLLRQGRITERIFRNHPARHQLEMALGGRHQKVDPQAGSLSVATGDRFILCTDGLVEGLWDNTLFHYLVDPPPRVAAQQPARRLVEESLSVSGRDNTTVIVLEL